MNVQIIKARLTNNPDAIIALLENAGFSDMSFNSHRQEIRAAREKGRNQTSVAVNVQNLKSACFSTNVYGDIITLIQEKINTNFVQTIEYISNVLDIDADIEYTPPFGGFYHTVCKTGSYETYQVETYQDNILNNYMLLPSILFARDNISYEVQKRYQIGYDACSKRIAVPWRYIDGKIGGIMGRYNSLETNEEMPKWLPIIPFPKNYFLFGYANNYNQIVKSGSCVLTESEKGVMQLSTYGFNNGLSPGGSHIGDRAQKILQTLSLDNIILGFDEGLEKDYIHNHAEEIKEAVGDDTEVCYIYDFNNEVLKKGSKDSPTDLGREKFIYLKENYAHYV